MFNTESNTKTKDNSSRHKLTIYTFVTHLKRENCNSLNFDSFWCSHCLFVVEQVKKYPLSRLLLFDMQRITVVVQVLLYVKTLVSCVFFVRNKTQCHCNCQINKWHTHEDKVNSEDKKKKSATTRY